MCFFSLLVTIWERPKSASYLRLENIQETPIMKFFNYHSAEKYPKGFSCKLENSFFYELGTSEKTNLPLEKNPKKYLVKKVAYCRKIQRDPLGS